MPETPGCIPRGSQVVFCRGGTFKALQTKALHVAAKVSERQPHRPLLSARQTASMHRLSEPDLQTLALPPEEGKQQRASNLETSPPLSGGRLCTKLFMTEAH